MVASAGVDIIVAGSSIFGTENPQETTRLMALRLAEFADRERSV